MNTIQSPDAGHPSELPSSRPKCSRRGWPPVVAVGVLGAVLGGLAVYAVMAVGPAGQSEPVDDEAAMYTATALFRVTAQQQPVAFRTADPPLPGDFQRYQRTQLQLLKSKLVLMAALRAKELRDLSVIRQQGDPIDWLDRALKVSFLDDSELMQVSLGGDDPEAVAAAVNAVADAYLREVDEQEHNRQLKRLNVLEKLYAEKESELMRKREDLRRFAEKLDVSDPLAADVKQRIALQEYAERRRELSPLLIELRQAQGDLKIQQALLSDGGKIQISETELDAFVQSDSVGGQLLYQRSQLQERLDDVQTTAIAPAKAQYSQKLQRDLQVLQTQLDARRAMLRDQLKTRRRAAMTADIPRLRARIAVLSEQKTQFDEDLDRQRQRIELLATPSIEAEMMRAEIQRLATVLDAIAEEKEILQVELQAAPRVSLLQRAEVPRAMVSGQ